MVTMCTVACPSKTAFKYISKFLPKEKRNSERATNLASILWNQVLIKVFASCLEKTCYIHVYTNKGREQHIAIWPSNLNVSL